MFSIPSLFFIDHYYLSWIFISLSIVFFLSFFILALIFSLILIFHYCFSLILLFFLDWKRVFFFLKSFFYKFPPQDYNRHSAARYLSIWRWAPISCWGWAWECGRGSRGRWGWPAALGSPGLLTRCSCQLGSKPATDDETM